MNKIVRIAVVVLAATLVAGACAKKTTAPSPAAQPATNDSPAAASGVTYTSHEFSFDGPSSLPAGTKDVTLTNEGAQKHQLVMIQVDEAHAGWTTEEVIAFVESDPNAQPKWATVAGGVVQPIGNGESGQAVFGDFSAEKPKIDPDGSLQAGTYFFMCFVTDPESKKPHAAIGMVEKVTVA